MPKKPPQPGTFASSDLKKIGRAPKHCGQWMVPINDPDHEGKFMCVQCAYEQTLV